MADDIDIEEHDLLDNPRIKNIFPDITCIKTEVIDYNEEDYQEQVNYEDNYDYSVPYDPDPMEYENCVPELYQNKIILGTKPPKTPECSDAESETTIRECSIILEDCGPMLDTSPYCEPCQTLFPTDNALDSHKMTTHSLLVAVSNNKAIKSTSKSALSALNFSSNSKGVLCNHCDKIFPDEIALIKHSYELIPGKYDGREIPFKSGVTDDLSTAKYMSCWFCSCLFKFKGNFLLHVKRFHGVHDESIPASIVTNFQCPFCSSIASNSKTYNAHIFYCHKSIYTKKIKKNDLNQFKCDPCNITFPTAYSRKIHGALKHPNAGINRDKHINRSKEPTTPASTLRRNQRPIPKSTLFSCDKCQIHFVSCLVAVEHSKRCVLTKGDWKCKKCRRSFKKADREAHMKQHEVSDRLKVIKIRDGSLDRILCRCAKCKICFDERNLLKYHSFGCSNNSFVYCSVCQVRIHENAMKKHKRIHSEFANDLYFVIIDYVFSDDVTKSKRTTEVALLKKRKENAFFYYFCPSCKLCMKINRTSNLHCTGKCNKSLAMCLCKLCGLKFSVKSYLSHKKVHKRVPSLKLRDMVFYNTQTGDKIDPPFPTFKKCKKCKVCFFSSLALRNHVCDTEEVKVCDYCGEKLSDLAYKLHVPFHEYRNENKLDSVLIKNYESLKTIWNILYVCKTCNTALDSYDDVVEHSQNHFCNMENYNVTIKNCNLCNLNFMGDSYERHENLHLAGNISKTSFEIISYNYEVLLTDKWLDIFKTLAPGQVDQILKKSIYKDTRCVRMSMVDNRNTDFTLYQCGVCSVMVESIKILQHTQNRNSCLKFTSFACSLCCFKFDSKTALKSHQILHDSITVDTQAFKIISFNNDKDVRINDSLKSVMNPEALKFIRCQHCGKLINKIKYSKHILNHKYADKKKLDKTKPPKFVVRPKFKGPAVAPHTFYKCKLCGVCVFKQNIKIHYCSKKNQKKQCNKCLLWFRASNIQKHNTYHEKYKFTRSVNIGYFKNGVIDNTPDRGQTKMVLYQCKDCKICIHQKHNIPRHKCCSLQYFKECKLCEVYLHSSHFYIHTELHEKKAFSKKSLTIQKFSVPSLSKLGVVVKPSLTLKAKDRYPKKDFKKQISMEKEIKHMLVADKTVNSELSSKSYYKLLSCRFFQCESCRLLFLTGSAVVKHAMCCEQDRDSAQCECGLVFHSSALKLHNKWQKCGQNGRTNFYVIALKTDNVVDFDLRRCLYMCKKCGIYYLSLDTIFRHFEQSHATVRSLVKCEQCDILFTSISNTKHKKIHHNTNKWSLTDINRFEVEQLTIAQIINSSSKNELDNESCASTANDSTSERRSAKRKYVENSVKVAKPAKEPVSKKTQKTLPGTCDMRDIYKCNICNLSFHHKNTLTTHYNVGRHRENRFTCKCGLAFTLKSLKRHLNVPSDLPISELEKLNIKIRKDDSNESQTSVVEAEAGEDLLKLFKCSGCDVYFLTLDMCQDHVLNHQILDPTEYIACKICELQFLCENLGSHMKTHRDKSFNIDELVVSEFQPDTSEVETYRAVDRLKSKAVSTTTHFDNEDDKAESVDTSTTS